jgi:hypothetical protein
MRYSTNIALKLEAKDYEFRSSIETPEVFVEDYKKDDIQITIDHKEKKVTIELMPDNPFSDTIEVKGVRTLNELELLHRFIYGAQKQIINNEEGD